MRTFKVTIRTNTTSFEYAALSESSLDAFLAAAEAQGDTPCGITVTPAAGQQ